MKKRLFALLASAILTLPICHPLCGGLTITAATDGNIVASGDCGDSLTWTLTMNGVLTIKGSGDMENYDDASVWHADSSYAPWNHATLPPVITLSLPDGITSIGSCAFQNCRELNELDLPEGLTEIGWKAFWGCESLSEITLPESVTKVGEHAFSNSGQKKRITVLNPECGLASEWLDMPVESNATIFGYGGSFAETFAKEKGLVFIELDAYGNPIGAPKGHGEYGGQEYRFKWDLNHFGVLSITGYGDMLNFSEDYDPSWLHCSVGVKRIMLEEGMTAIGNNAFANCPELEKIIIPSTVTRIGTNAFGGDTTIKRITIPAAVTEIGCDAFRGCDALNALTILNPDCEIGYSALREQTTIYGYCGSTAERFAEKHDLAFVPLSAAPSEGDLNGDGKTTVADAVLLMRMLSETGRIPAGIASFCDMDEDGLLTMQDVTALLAILKETV